MFKNIFYRSCALVSEVEDTLRHLYRWHRSWSTPPRDRVLDMYALEDRVLFSISPILKAAALQAGAGGTGAATVHNPQTSAMPALNHALHAAGRGPAAQAARQALDASHNADNGSITAAWAHVRARHDTRHPHAAGNSDNRSVNFVIIDDSLQNLDQLIRSLNPNSEVLLYDHLTESPSEVLNRVSNWAQSHHAQIDTLSILSHGVNGSFVLGNQWLSTSNLADSAPAWQRLGAVMAAGGSIDIFGCNVAAGSNGQNLINDIGRLSGTTVFASVDNTGRGGNWVLEAASTPGTSAVGPASGQTTADASAWQNPLNAAMLQQWDGLLTSILVTNANDSGAGSLRQAILDANANPGMDYITFAIPGSGVHTIALNSALPNITDTVSIDGYTQSGASPNTLTVGDNAVLEIELRGASAGSAANGLVLDAGSSGSVIKGLDIEGFAQTGIYILSSNNIISGDFIGTNAAGSAALGNSYGVYALNGQYNTIGGTTAAARNLISGNATEGVYIDSANFTTVTGNYIGTNAAGSGAIANNIGIYSYNASYTTIGGVAVGAGNVISGNSNCGIHMDWGLTGNVIQGNYIGTNASATAAVPNATGVMANHTTGLTIGGTAAGTGNVISGNSGDGVKIADDSPDNPSTVRVQGNSIYSNGGLGIDLGGDGVTANDAGDVDTGPNYLQNFPVLTDAAINGSNFSVRGTFNSTANTTFRVEIYANTAADPTGYGEGQRYIGSFNVTTDSGGNITFTNVFNNVTVAVGESISATATNISTNCTSEFSQCKTAAAPGIIITPTSGLTTTEDSVQNGGHVATFQVVLNSQPTANVTVSLTSSNTNEGTLSTTTLTFTAANWNSPQTVTVTGVNDFLVGNITYAINFSVASADPDYGGMTVPSLSVTNLDNDTYNTIYVDTTSDVNDTGLDPATMTIAQLYANKGGDGQISLREAIIAADNTANGPGGPDRIYFNLPAGSHTITPSTALPIITDAVIIDGNSGAGSGAPTVEINGQTANNVGLWLNVGSDGSTLRNLVLNRNGWEAIRVDSNNNTIAGCYIGTDVTGTAASANGVLGANAIWLTGNNNIVGGTTAVDRNVISGNTRDGVLISGSGNTVEGNYIGVAAGGNAALGNANSGVEIDTTSVENTISGNVISGNAWRGIDCNGTYNTIVGNILGLGADGSTVIGNGYCGISLDGGYNTVGGAIAADRNIISGNLNDGIYIDSSYNTIQGNYIGADSTGLISKGNGWEGIRVTGTATYNAIGGTGTGDGNVIAFNTQQGIGVWGNAAVGNSILGNAIYSNSDIGIDLINTFAGVTVNDPGDADAGGNNLQNFPELSTATTTGTQICITGTFNSVPSTNYRLEFFSNVVDDPTHYGEGQTYLGYVNVTTDANGNVTAVGDSSGTATMIAGTNNFAANFNTSVPGGQYISATATNLATSDTSEFARVVTANLAGLTITPTSGLTTSEDGASAQFTVKLNAAPSGNVVVSVVSNDTTEGSVSTSSLTFTPSNWNTAQTVTVTGVDDNVVDGNILYTVGVSIDSTHSDALYAGASSQNVSLTNIDNDSAGVVISPTTTLYTSDDGGTAQFSVKLNSQPTDNVTITLTNTDVYEGTLSGDTLSADSKLVFTPDTWNTPQTVTITGKHDYAAANVGYSVTFAVASGDTIYNNKSVSSVSVINNNTLDSYNTITVTSAADTNPIGTTTYNLTQLYEYKTLHPGSISLREAIIAANNTPNAVASNAADADHICFNIAASGVQTITLGSALPSISDAVFINGYTEPGALAATDTTTATLEIVITGPNSIASGIILASGSSYSTIQGLDIGGFSSSNGSGISILSSNNKISGNYVGINYNSTAALANFDGILISGASATNNVIGGTTAAERNVLTGNADHGIFFNGAVCSSDYSNANIVEGDYIGLNAAGTASLRNPTTNSPGTSYDGIDLASSNYNIIGGTIAGARNIISGNSRYGIYVNTNSVGNKIQGNYIGLNPAGTAAIGNLSYGIRENNSANHTIFDSNVITGNSSDGIHIENTGCTYNTITNNKLGTDAAGTAVLTNTGIGIYTVSNSNTITGNLVRGFTSFGIQCTSTSGSNTITGNTVRNNTSDGIRMEGGGSNTITGNMVGGNRHGIFLNGGTNNVIGGNFIGVDWDGVTVVANSGYGIVLNPNANSNTIGYKTDTNGTVISTGNIISGNAQYGIYVSGASSNVIRGNYIGTNGTTITVGGVQYAPGTYAIGNGYSGIVIRNSGSTAANNNIIGGTDPNFANVIAYNTYYGIRIDNTNAGTSLATGNSFLGNSIHDNGLIGVNLTNSSADPTADGITLNGTSTLGGNNYQHFPILSSARIDGSTLQINGSLAVASGNYRIELFANGTTASSGDYLNNADPTLAGYYGEGKTYLGYLEVTFNGATTVTLNGNSANTNVTVGSTTSGTFTFAVTFSGSTVANGTYISATATQYTIGSPNVYGNTSEFSRDVVANVPGVTVTPSSGLITTESKTTDSFSVVLNAVPTSNVTIAVASSDPTQGTVSTSSLVFTPSNWNQAQSVTVNGVYDPLQTGANSYHISLTASSADALYNNLPIPDVGAINIDGNLPGFTIISNGNLSTTQTQGTATFQVVLDMAPTSNVTINLASSNPSCGGTVTAGSTLTFSPTDWFTPQNVTVTGMNNYIYGNINYTINMSVAAGSAPEYIGIYTPSVPVTNIDYNTYSTIYVTNNSDVVNGDTSSIAALYANPGADGISLREAIIAANNSVNGPGGPDRIYFNLPDGEHIISVTSQLPDISTPMIIDGTTEPHYAGSPIVEIAGVANAVGLNVTSSGASDSPGSTIRGLVINNFGDEGILVSGDYNTIAGCYVGTDVTGTVAVTNATSGWHSDIWITGNNNIVGGTAIADRNVISGNRCTGLWMDGNNNTVEGNYIGVDVTGNVALGNGGSSVGTGTAAVGNVISDNVISGNGNCYNGIKYYGIECTGTGTVITNNYVGVGADGNTAIGNYNHGIYVTSSGNTITGNVISANQSYGVYLYYSSNNIIQGNYIGLNAAGNAIIGNLSWGIDVFCGNNNLIGGTTPAQRNVISGNAQAGVVISTYSGTASASNNIIEGNYIGTYADGTGALGVTGNLKDGINFRGGTQAITNNTIGGTNPNQANLIAYNADCGVRIDVSTATGNPILGNSIHDNGLLGINLTTSLNPAADGTVTYNDNLDADTGGNNLQNFPVLSMARISGSQISIVGSLNSTANSTFRIEFFANASADPTGYGEGQRYLGYTNVTTDASGNAVINVTLASSVTDGEFISATATNSTTNDTSEFAQDVAAHTPGIDVRPLTDMYTTEDGGTAQFSVVLHSVPTSDVEVGISSTNTGEGTVSTPSLTFTSSNWNVPQTVTVTGVMDYVTDGNAPYTITVSPVAGGDVGYNSVHGVALSLTNIDHVNRPPVLTVPAKQTTSTFILFSSAAENAITVEDIDAGTSPLQVQLTATNGQLTLGSTSGLSFIAGSGSGDAAVEFRGSSDAVNAALDGMKFTPSASSGSLQITVNDQGYSGSGGPQSATANVAIEVATAKRQSLPPPLMAPAPPSLPSPPSPTPAPPASPIYINPNFMHSFEQNSHFVRAEATDGNKVIGRGIGNMLPGNAQLAKIAPVDASNDYLSTHDRFQTYVIQPIITKLSEGNLTLQSVMDTQLLWKEIKEIATQGETLPWLSKINVGTVIGLSAGISAGYIMMAFRWGALITSGLATTFPVWQWIDPLPILESSKNKSGGQEFLEDTDPNAKSQLNESLESLIS